MVRQRNWSNKLIRMAHSLMGEPLEWGETDCLHVAIKCINEMYEEPIIEEKLYDSLRGAKEFYEGHGKEEVAEMLQASIVAPEKATCGDIVLDGRDDEGFPSVHVIMRRAWITSNTEHGVVVEDKDLSGDIEVYRVPV